VEFNTLDANGRFQRNKGAYLTVDGGMTKMGVYIDPMKERLDFDSVHWSEWWESLRKDVECAFGVLKARFRILLNRIEFHDPALLHSIFITCCILHNMLIIINGTGVDDTMDQDYWERNHPEAAEWIPEDTVRARGRQVSAEEQRHRFNLTREMFRATPMNGKAVLEYTALYCHKRLRNALVASFQMQYKSGLMCSPRGKLMAKNIMIVVDRAELESFWSLIVRPSRICVPKADGSPKNMGLGLFTGMRYKRGDRITFFRGNVVSKDTFELEENQRYGVWIGRLQVLDCHLHAAAGICKASMANSPRGATHRDTGVACVCNVKCVPNPAMKRAYLCALRDINIGEELLWDYGPSFELSGDEGGGDSEQDDVIDGNDN